MGYCVFIDFSINILNQALKQHIIIDWTTMLISAVKTFIIIFVKEEESKG